MEKIADSKLLITGGAGFIGSHLAETLLSQDCKVTVIDNFDHYYDPEIKRKNIEKIRNFSKFSFLKGSILDPEALTSVMRDVDVVFHLAARPGVRASVENPFLTANININGTLQVLENARKLDVKKLVVASSSSVYGNAKYRPTDEACPLNPISPYGVSKVASEIYCETYYRLYNTPVTMLRYFTVYGPRQRPDMLMHKAISKVLRNESPIIFGDGNQSRDFTYVDDAVQGTILAWISKESLGEVVNIGGGNNITVNDLVKLLIEECDKTGIIEPKHTEKALGDVKHTQANISKAREKLGYSPKIGVKEGVKRMVKWYKETYLSGAK
ncbi:MAG: GDP-mannose 4,6-dehydratase [Candidatus Hodarchaeota archaeon]